MSSDGKPSRLGWVRRRLESLTPTQAELERQDLSKSSAREGSIQIGLVRSRETVQVTGVIRSVTLQPRATVPNLDVEIGDGSGILHLVWLGRREIPGIVTGARLTARGRAGVASGVLVIYNPRYELHPRHG